MVQPTEECEKVQQSVQFVATTNDYFHQIVN